MIDYKQFVINSVDYLYNYIEDNRLQSLVLELLLLIHLTTDSNTTEYFNPRLRTTALSFSVILALHFQSSIPWMAVLFSKFHITIEI